MHRHRFSGLLMRPSLFSSIVCTLLAVGVVIGANWSFVLENVLFYDYFFGREGLVTTLQDSAGGGSAIGEVLTSKSLGHNVMILGGAVLAMIGLYVVLRLVMWLMGSIAMTLKEVRAVDGPAKDMVEHELERRVGIRVLVAAVWAAYAFITVKVILPFCILASEVGLNEDRKVSEGIAYILFVMVLLFATLHVHVILARLFLLRPRVFGVDEALLRE